VTQAAGDRQTEMRRDKAITAAGQSLDKTRGFRVVAKDFADLPYAEIQCLFKIDEGFLTPDVLPDLFPRDQNSWVASQ